MSKSPSLAATAPAAAYNAGDDSPVFDDSIAPAASTPSASVATNTTSVTSASTSAAPTISSATTAGSERRATPQKSRQPEPPPHKPRRNQLRE